MIELAQHIEVLLLENDCVIVPGFGGFVAHYAPATHVKEESLFLPPTRTIGFNPQLKLMTECWCNHIWPFTTLVSLTPAA